MKKIEIIVIRYLQYLVNINIYKIHPGNVARNLKIKRKRVLESFETLSEKKLIARPTKGGSKWKIKLEKSFYEEKDYQYVRAYIDDQEITNTTNLGHTVPKFKSHDLDLDLYPYQDFEN